MTSASTGPTTENNALVISDGEDSRYHFTRRSLFQNDLEVSVILRMNMMIKND